MWSLGMILHKLLFFRLPYRYSSDCDDPSRPKDGKEFADRLEDEILRYPGFRHTPPMVTAFESRRLPRAYLYLLENLLHVKPTVRMSSERVMNAIKEGSVSDLMFCHCLRQSLINAHSASAVEPFAALRLTDVRRRSGTPAT